MSDAMHERVLRGIPRWLLVGYLEELGGSLIETDAGEVVARTRTWWPATAGRPG